MSTPNSDSQHWRELAAQLGLPPDEPTGESATPRRAERPTEPEPPSPIVEPRQDSIPETAELAAKPDTAAEDTGLSGQHTHIEAPPPIDDEQRQRRPRRRGRRGARRGEAGSPQELEAETAPELVGDAGLGVQEAKDEPETAPERPRRGGGRSRGKKSPPDKLVVSAPPKLHEPAGGPTEPVSADTDEDEDDMSSWNIPSWQDLIDSLYRPDR